MTLTATAAEASTDRPSAAISRQAIVDASRKVVGYALFERPRAAANDNAMLFEALSESGSEALAGSKTVFVHCSFEIMADGHLDILDPRKAVLQIPQDESLTKEGVAIRRDILLKARKDGFRLALDQRVLQPAFASWLPLVSYIMLDLQQLDGQWIERTIRAARERSKAEIVAQNVRDGEQHEALRKLGVRYFQGHWFAQPTVVRDSGVQASQHSVIRLMNLVRTEAEVSEIEAFLKHDPTLSFKLLRFINSCGFGLSTEITSFRHAVMILGFNRLFRWAALLMTSTRAGGAAPAAGSTAVVRARLMELLATDLLPPEACDDAFLVGLFSLLDTLVGVPMAEAVASMNLPGDVSQALLDNGGPFAPFLELAKACESGDEVAFARAAGELQLSNHQVNWAHLQALIWADEIEGLGGR